MATPLAAAKGNGGVLKLRDVLAQEALLRELSTPAFVADARLQLLYANPAFLRFTEVRPSDIMEAGSAGSFLGSEVGQVMDACRAARLPQARADVTATTPAGKTLRIHLKAVPLFDEKGQVAGTIQFMVDTSVELRLHEKYRRVVAGERADRMAAEVLTQQLYVQLADSERSATLGALAGGIAHELNNPLQVISGQAELMRMALERTEPPGEALLERFRERLKEIDENIQRCQLVTRRLLGFLRSGAELELVPDDLGEVLRQAERYLRFHPSGCGVEVRIEAEPVGRVPMARDLLVQLFLNLFVNACEATGGMGTVRAGVRPAGDGVVEVTVADAGPGIPEELRARIFEPFVTTKPKGRGTGIGLFLVRYIVNQHRGRISVECPPQGGTLFRIVLPLEAAAP